MNESLGVPKVKRRVRLHWRLLRMALVGYVLWCIVGCSLLRTVVFPRHMVEPLPAERAGVGIPGLQKLTITTDEGPVEAWFVPGDGVTPELPGAAVIYAHGNAELIEQQHDVIAGYTRMGVSVMLVEFRGYGRSAGSPSQTKITADFTAAYDMLAALPRVDRSRIIFHGRSIGTGVVCSLAATRKPAALILTSPMTSITAMAAGYWVPWFAVPDPFDNLTVVRQLDAPVLVMHGRHDTLIPFHHGQTLAAAAKHGTLIAYDCDHNDVPTGSRRYWDDIAGFLRASGVLPQQEVEQATTQRVPTPLVPAYSTGQE